MSQHTHFAELGEVRPRDFIRSQADYPEPSTEALEVPPWKVVIGLAISPLLVIGAVSLVAYLLTNWK